MGRRRMYSGVSGREDVGWEVIPEEVIEEIKLASDIVAPISDYLPLKRTGKL